MSAPERHHVEPGGSSAGGADSAGGVRRRRSSHPDDDELRPDDNAAVQLQDMAPDASITNGQGPANRAHARSSSTSSAVDVPSATYAANAQPAESRTVRFSAEVDRPPIQGTRSPRSGLSPTNSTSRNTRRPLALDTGMNSSRNGEGTGATEGQEPLAPGRPGARSPLSPTSRLRGYSLRSNLFRRNIDDQRTVLSPIELEDASAASSSATRAQLAGSTPSREASKKSNAPTVSIKPINEAGSSANSSPKARKDALSSALPNYESWIQSRSEKAGLKRGVRNAVKAFKKTILRIHEIPPSKDGRHIVLDASRRKDLVDERTGKPYVENWIRSTRFTIYTFVPKQLVAQFSKLANFYFLCVAILQMIPNLSTTGMYTTIAPLSFFVAISMAKEGYDDYRRYRLDKEENRKQVAVLRAHQPGEDGPSGAPAGSLHWVKVKWSSLRVGDIVKLDRDDAVPADLVLLNSTGPNQIAYVETMALDGETNLKSKQTTTSLIRACATLEDVAACRAHFVVEDPNTNLYSFEGKVTVDEETAPLTNAEIIYRGSILRNTPSAIGMVIYSGEECKIRMNSNKNLRIKAPHLQFVLNRFVAIVVIFVLLLAVFNTVAYRIWHQRKERRSWYLEKASVPFHQSLSAFFIMFSTMIPLSLYVSMEIIKLAQMFLLSDVDMYDEKSNTPFEARTSTINEELGQISYIFSDKTGTLTDNEMKFRKVSVAGTTWLHDVDLKNDDKNMLIHKKRNKGKKAARKSFMSDRRRSTYAPSTDMSIEASQEVETPPTALARGGEPTWKSSARPSKSQPDLRTRDMMRYLLRRPDSAFAEKARMLLLSIALCHTCLPETRSDGTIEYQSSSPDELALLNGARELGYVVIDREQGTVTLRLEQMTDPNIEPIEEVYQVLDVIEFSSTRKRMSVLVRFPDGRVCVICKGADSIVMERLKLADLAMHKATEVEKRAERRKSLEASVAIARRSTQVERTNSMHARTSLNIGAPRRSMSGAARNTGRAEVDSWLRSRERDVELVGVEEDDPLHASRASTQFRQSIAGSEARSSMAFDDDEELVDEALVGDEEAVMERCFQHINDFATEGLRTLLYGYRFMSDNEYSQWKEIYLAAKTSLVDREDKVEKAGELVEYDFELAGATAIEDKLQKGVPESIDKLRRANIKMWMLTGDKRETAINIGHSCRLIKDYSTVIVLDRETGEVEQRIATGIVALNNRAVAHCVVVIDGQTLKQISESKALEALFYELTVLADSVICCRAQPNQKAQLVKGIRKRVKDSITLAIGDGANDIAMIQEAHVGIGITGKEGLQAARTSDYSIAQFRFLNKLLLVHGRWNYVRTCKYILGTLWKELLFFLTQALYQRWAGYTGTSLYESWSLATFNTLFTSLPVLCMGIFEKDLAAATLLAVPELYTKGQRNEAFNLRVYAGWMFMAASEAMILYFIMMALFGNAIFTTDNSLFAMGDLTFVACVVLISMKMQLIEMHNISIIAAGSVFLSIGAVFLWNLILGAAYPNDKIYRVRHAWFIGFGRNPLWWLTLILTILCVAVFEFGVTSLRRAYFPTDADLFQELEQDLDIRKRFEEAAAMELQQGWNRGEKKGSFEIKREQEVEEILRRRGDTAGHA